MSMGQQLGSQTKPNVLAGMTPAAGNKALPGAQPGKPPANQLQQAMAPKGPGPVAPQPLPQQNIAFENRAANQRGNMGINQQAKPAMGPVAPQGMGSQGSITGLTQNTQAQQAQMQQRNIMRQARGGGY